MIIKHKKSSGFTLIELLVVMMIIGVLLSAVGYYINPTVNLQQVGRDFKNTLKTTCNQATYNQTIFLIELKTEKITDGDADENDDTDATYEYQDDNLTPELHIQWLVGNVWKAYPDIKVNKVSDEVKLEFTSSISAYAIEKYKIPATSGWLCWPGGQISPGSIELIDEKNNVLNLEWDAGLNFIEEEE